MKIDFIVPTLNFSGVRKTLESIRKHTPPENVGLIILIDQTLKKQDYANLVDLHIYTHGKNLGYAKCFNMGVKLSENDYVAIWNDDAECINSKWVQGIEETFRRYDNALCVNPASPRNPRASGEEPVNNMGIDYKEEFPEEDYNLMLEKGQGHIIDGICMFATIFKREKLDKLKGVVPGAWMDEYFYPGGGEDYDVNRRAYLSGMRCLGTNLSFIWHWWYSTRRVSDGVAGVKHCGSAFNDKWGEGADLYGRTGIMEVPNNIVRPFKDCK